jgi:hypothetical protein
MHTSFPRTPPWPTFCSKPAWNPIYKDDVAILFAPFRADSCRRNASTALSRRAEPQLHSIDLLEIPRYVHERRATTRIVEPANVLPLRKRTLCIIFIEG